MLPRMKAVQAFGRKGVSVVGAFIVGTEIIAQPYELTALSLGAAALTVAKPAALGLLDIQMQNPDIFNVKMREQLRDTSPHVSNVNIAMDAKGSPIHEPTIGILLAQHCANPTFGSPLDRSYEKYIVGSFHDAYKNNSFPAGSLAEYSPEELAKIRQDRSFDAVGVAAHTVFSAVKHFAYNLRNPELNKFNQYERSERDLAEVDDHQEQIKHQFNERIPTHDLASLFKYTAENLYENLDKVSLIDKFKSMKNSNSNLKNEGIAKIARTETENAPDAVTPTKFR